MLAVSDTVWLAVITMFGTIISSAMALILAWINRVKNDVAAVKIGQEKTDANVQKIEKATNSIVGQLIQTTRREAHAAGVEEQRNKTDPPSESHVG